MGICAWNDRAAAVYFGANGKFKSEIPGFRSCFRRGHHYETSWTILFSRLSHGSFFLAAGADPGEAGKREASRRTASYKPWWQMEALLFSSR